MERGEEQTCNSFRSWQEEIYWTHFQFIHFTQFLNNHFQQLELPKTFSNNVRKKLPENVSLKSRSGVVWNIGLRTRDDSVYFTNGWQQFMKDHSLKENDFLVFKYNGKSHFEVLIFDGESFCEKATSYFVGKYKHAETEQGGDKAKETDNYVEEVNTVSNGGVECGLREKFRHINNIGTPLAAPFETPNGKTFNGRVQFASPEQVMADAVTKTAASAAFPSQPTGKRTKRPDNEASAVQNNRQGTSPIAGWKTDFFSMLSAKHGVTCHETSKGMPFPLRSANPHCHGLLSNSRGPPINNPQTSYSDLPSPIFVSPPLSHNYPNKLLIITFVPFRYLINLFPPNTLRRKSPPASS